MNGQRSQEKINSIDILIRRELHNFLQSLQTCWGDDAWDSCLSTRDDDVGRPIVRTLGNRRRHRLSETEGMGPVLGERTRATQRYRICELWPADGPVTRGSRSSAHPAWRGRRQLADGGVLSCVEKPNVRPEQAEGCSPCLWPGIAVSKLAINCDCQAIGFCNHVACFPCCAQTAAAHQRLGEMSDRGLCCGYCVIQDWLLLIWFQVNSV